MRKKNVFIYLLGSTNTRQINQGWSSKTNNYQRSAINSFKIRSNWCRRFREYIWWTIESTSTRITRVGKPVQLTFLSIYPYFFFIFKFIANTEKQERKLLEERRQQAKEDRRDKREERKQRQLDVWLYFFDFF